MKFWICFALVVLFGCKATSDTTKVSEEASALFTVNGVTVPAEEFIYIYKKNNVNNDSAFTRKDINDYLDLYINFKLKVAEAIRRGMDTTAAFQREFSTYKEQLKKPYLTENKATEKLIAEAYERYKEEVNAAHILISVDPKASPEDTLKAYNTLMGIREEALRGTDFGALARKHSADPSAQQNNGALGYFTSFQMVYPFESAAYQTPEGEISMPVRTRFGYHLIKVLDKRPSQGSIEVSHIMIRIKPEKADSLKARNKIFELYDQAVGGVNWNDLARQFSDDINTKNIGGTLKPFKVGQMPDTFQEAAFALEQLGDISDPVMTPYGWHIIKLEKKLPLESFKEMEASIRSRISKDVRADLNKKAFIARLKKENGFEETAAKSQLFDVADSVLRKIFEDNQLITQVLFKVRDQQYTVGDYFDYLKEQGSMTQVSKDYIRKEYNKFTEACIIAYEESHLKDKYVDYRMLVKEYWEGILLFELMEDEVWNRAVKDTAGLHTYYSNNSEEYYWPERVDAVVYNSDQQDVLVDIERLINAGDSTALTKKKLEKRYNDKTALTLQISEGLFEHGSSKIIDQLEWTKGIHMVKSNGRFNLVWIREILQPEQKRLNDIKGLVISDYQNHLETLWVKDLRAQYPVTIDKNALTNIYEVLEK
ncbi:MAG: peptidylprolyl isomerase [Fulvivirga sp.]